MRAPLLVSLAALAGCAGMVDQLTVTPAGPGLVLAPRPADCKIEFYRTRPPDRAYDEVATLHFEGAAVASSSADVAQEGLRIRACALGADAVVVTRDFMRSGPYTPGVMTGTAVSYPEERAKHRLDEALRRAEVARKAEEAARKAQEAEAARLVAAKADGKATATRVAPAAAPPAGFVPRTVKEWTLARALPDRRSDERGELQGGSEVWVDPKPKSGWHRVWTPDVRAGWVEAEALRDVSRPAPAQAPAPGPGPAAAPTEPKPADAPPSAVQAI